MPYIIDAITAETVNVNQELLVNGNPVLNYKKYVALLNQSGTDAPVATVLENTLGGEPVWTRVNDGQYTCTLAGAFPQNKTFCSVTYGPNNGVSPMVSMFGYNLTTNNNSNLELSFSVPSTDVFTDPQNDPCNDICILIEVYP
jgi:hypothetical protein